MDENKDKNIFNEGTDDSDKAIHTPLNNQQFEYETTAQNDIKETVSYEYKVAEPTPITPPNPPIYSNQPQNQNWTTPPQSEQTNWDYQPHYGSLGTTPLTPPKPPKMPKPPKPPKQKKPASGLKAFAIVLSIMFVVSIGLSGVLLVMISTDDNKIENNITSKEKETDLADKDNLLTLNESPKGEEATNNSDGSLTTQEVFKKASPSVVGIVTYVKQGGHQVYSQGSGVIITDDGYIVTNAHVVMSEDEVQMPISKIEVVLSNGEYYTADLIGTDIKTDIGVLKITAPNLTPSELGNSDELEVGEPVIVIGNPDGIKFANSLTQGAVSALNREVETSTTGKPVKYIQTDATINPGNSGGAMVNQFGQVVGIPVAKIVKTGFEGMGFAIPINDAKPIVESIIKNGYVAGRPKIGIWYAAIPESYSILNGLPLGLRVSDVDETFDAYKKGVQKGDIITHMDDVEMVDSAALSEVLDTKKPGDTLKLTIYRVNEMGIADTIKIDIIVGEDKSMK